MKITTLLASLILLVIACQKEPKISKIEMENLRIDSINQERQKINDSIQKRNEMNRYPALAGAHTLSFSNFDTEFKGPIHFEVVGRDRYKVSGKIVKGSNHVEIQGEILQVSPKHLNFEGIISQRINATNFERPRKTTFTKEGKEPKFRLQHKVGGQGFVEYIDIHL